MQKSTDAFGNDPDVVIAIAACCLSAADVDPSLQIASNVVAAELSRTEAEQIPAIDRRRGIN